MTGAAWTFAGVTAVAMAANWWSRWTDHRPTERWSKPLALGALIGVAVTLDPADPTVRAWFVAALVFSLAGDVFLLDGDRWFVAGLGAFLVAHVCYTLGFVAADGWRWGTLVVSVPLLGALAATAGRRIVAGAHRGDRTLAGPVIAYLAVISTMAVAAAAAGNAWAILGAVLFVASDTVLGWRQFVSSARWMPMVVMITYHLGQVGLVASLV